MALDEEGMTVVKDLMKKIQLLSPFPMAPGETLTIMNALEKAYDAGRMRSWNDELASRLGIKKGEPTALEKFQEKGDGEWI